MFINNGFTFLNIKGVYKFDGNIIVPLYEYGLTPVYSPHVKQDKSIFYEFLALDGKDKDSIIRFTNKYGLLFHGNIIENNNNNYLFFNDQKEQFSQVISANRYEITYQHYSEVITFCQKFMDLITGGPWCQVYSELYFSVHNVCCRVFAFQKFNITTSNSSLCCQCVHIHIFIIND